MKHLTMKFLEVTFFAVAFVICKEVGTKPQYFYPGYPFLQQQPVVVQRDDCGWLGCVDQTIGSSVISGVNGTFLGIGSAATGIANGTSALVTGGAVGAGAAAGGIAASGGNAIGNGLQTIGETIGGNRARLCYTNHYSPNSPIMRILTYC